MTQKYFGGHVYDAAYARALVAQLNAEEEDGWTYEADVEGAFGRINVYDAEHILVGVL